MIQFEKTTVNVVSAVLFLLGLYALGGLAYAAWLHSGDSMLIWAVVAVLAFAGSFGYQQVVVHKRKRAP